MINAIIEYTIRPEIALSSHTLPGALRDSWITTSIILRRASAIGLIIRLIKLSPIHPIRSETSPRIMMKDDNGMSGKLRRIPIGEKI